MLDLKMVAWRAVKKVVAMAVRMVVP